MLSVRFSPVIHSDQSTYIDESIPKPPSMKPISYTKKRPRKKKRPSQNDENDLIKGALPRHLLESHNSTLLSEEKKRVLVKQMLRDLLGSDTASQSGSSVRSSQTSRRSRYESAPEKPFVKFHQNRMNPFYWRDPVVVELNQQIETETWNFAKVHAKHIQKKDMLKKRENALAIREQFRKHQKRNLLRRLKSGEPTVVNALEDYVESSVGSSRDTQNGESSSGIASVASSVIASPPPSMPMSKKSSFSSVSTSGFRKYTHTASSHLNPRPPLPHYPVHVQQHGQRDIAPASSTRSSRYGQSTIFQRVLQPSASNGIIDSANFSPHQEKITAVNSQQRQLSAPSAAQRSKLGSSRIKSRLYAHINKSTKKPLSSHASRRKDFDPNRPVLSSDYTGRSWRRRNMNLEVEEPIPNRTPRDELASLDEFEKKLAEQSIRDPRQ